METETTGEPKKLTQMVWVSIPDLTTVYAYIKTHGCLDHTEIENPRETEDPYYLVEHYTVDSDIDAEIYYLDKKGKKLADIRLLIGITKEQVDEMKMEMRTPSNFHLRELKKLLDVEKVEKLPVLWSEYIQTMYDRVLGK